MGHFLVCAMPASQLRRLAGIYRREATPGVRRNADMGIQRRHDATRSTEIAHYVRYGFPWSSLSERQRNSPEYHDLRKPGWLPSSVIVNVLTGGDRRRGVEISPTDLIAVDDHGAYSSLTLPGKASDSNWDPEVPPIEIIDGQHRLFAFEEIDGDDFELPVVAFVGLDLSWQAYVFYTVNIKPKRINPSLAFDLYPMLRTEDWLQHVQGPTVYRETRAQELTELLWSYPDSPWAGRINMLGEGRKGVSQASWIRSLLATFIKAYSGKGVRGIGGLFGSVVGTDHMALPWVTLQQAAFLIFSWQRLASAIGETNATWATELRRLNDESISNTDTDKVHYDPAFASNSSLLATDQGVRGFLHVLNDTCWVRADDLRLSEWQVPGEELLGEPLEAERIAGAIGDLETEAVAPFVSQLASSLATFDWRSSSAHGLSREERTAKAAFRGSGGYRELRLALLRHVASSDWGSVSAAAESVLAVVEP